MTGKNILKSLAQALLACILMFASGTACAKIDPYRGLSLELSEVSENLTFSSRPQGSCRTLFSN